MGLSQYLGVAVGAVLLAVLFLGLAGFSPSRLWHRARDPGTGTPNDTGFKNFDSGSDGGGTD